MSPPVSKAQSVKYPAKAHARNVAKHLTDGPGLIYIPGRLSYLFQDSDSSCPFRQKRYFFYISGVDEADCYITYDIAQDELVLWIPRQRTPREIYYMGPVLTPEVALEKYDIDAAKPADTLAEYLKDFSCTGRDAVIYVLHKDDISGNEPGEFLHTASKTTVDPRFAFYYLRDYAGDHGPIDTEQLMPAMNSCRVIKDDFEIGYIREANRISAVAHTEVLKNITKVSNEAAVEGIFIGTCLALGAKKQAYPPIAGSGQNAATLHYVNNNEALKGRQVLLLDAGCEINCYACDVTRTFPIGPDWPSVEAKQIYDVVNRMQSVCIAQMKVGNHFGNVHALAHYVATHGLLQLGILQNGTIKEIVKAGTTLAFFPHGLGHHVGLEVHDVEDEADPISITTFAHAKSEQELYAVKNTHLIDPLTCRSPVTLESSGLREGMVVTVEPGIYFNEYGLKNVYLPSPIHSKYINQDVLKRFIPVGGVRIEDDILITKEGPVNLTTAPKGDEAIKIIRDHSSKK